MNKEVFLHQLRVRLSQLPEDEIQKRLDYYSEMIEDMIEDGLSEEDAVANLGDVNSVAQQIMQEVPLPTLMKTTIKPKKGWTTAAVVLAVIGSPLWICLLLAFILVVLSVYISIWAVIISAFAVVASLGLLSLYLLYKAAVLAFTTGLSVGALTLGTGLILAGLCLLSFLGAKIIARDLIRATGWFAHQVKNLFIKNNKEAVL